MASLVRISASPRRRRERLKTRLSPREKEERKGKKKEESKAWKLILKLKLLKFASSQGYKGKCELS